MGDRISSLFGLLSALYVLKESIGYDVGGLHHPGAGFFPMFGAMILATFSVILLVRSFLVTLTPAEGKNQEVQEEQDNPRLVIYTLLAIILYALIFEYAGFIVSTFLLVVFLLKLFDRKKWWVVLLTAGLISSASYTIFAVLLKSELPMGILEVFF